MMVVVRADDRLADDGLVVGAIKWLAIRIAFYLAVGAAAVVLYVALHVEPKSDQIELPELPAVLEKLDPKALPKIDIFEGSTTKPMSSAPSPIGKVVYVGNVEARITSVELDGSDVSKAWLEFALEGGSLFFPASWSDIMWTGDGKWMSDGLMNYGYGQIAASSASGKSIMHSIAVSAEKKD